MRTPDLHQSASLSAKFTAERYIEEKNATEPVENSITDQDITLPTGVFKLWTLQELRTPDEFTIDIIFPGSTLVTLKFPSVVHRDEVKDETKRLLQVALDNRFIEEAEEILKNYEEDRYNYK